MKKIAIISLVVAAWAADAAVMATLVRQYMGRSVTGQPIVVCVYRYGNQTFEEYLPFGNMCQPSIMIQ